MRDEIKKCLQKQTAQSDLMVSYSQTLKHYNIITVAMELNLEDIRNKRMHHTQASHDQRVELSTFDSFDFCQWLLMSGIKYKKCQRNCRWIAFVSDTWRLKIHNIMYFQSPGVTSIDVFSLCRLWTETPNLGEFGVTDLDQHFSETRILGRSNDTKIVSIR